MTGQIRRLSEIEATRREAQDSGEGPTANRRGRAEHNGGARKLPLSRILYYIHDELRMEHCSILRAIQEAVHQCRTLERGKTKDTLPKKYGHCAEMAIRHQQRA